MRIKLAAIFPEKFRTNVMVVGAIAEAPLPASTRTLDQASKGKLSAVLERGDLEGKAGASLLLHDLPGVVVPRVLLISLGWRDEFGGRAFSGALDGTATFLAGGTAMDAAVPLLSQFLIARADGTTG